MTYSQMMQSFFTDGTPAVTVASLVDFLSYKKNQKKQKIHQKNEEQTLSSLMKGIRFVASTTPPARDHNAILDALYQEYDQQNTLTTRFLHHLRDV